MPIGLTKSFVIISQGILYSCNEMHADYLFPKNKFYDTQYDTGDKVIQCGRHNDIFKLWLQWRAKVGSTQTEVTTIIGGNKLFTLTLFVTFIVSGNARHGGTRRP